MLDKTFYPAPILFEQSNWQLHWLDKFLLYTITNKIWISGTQFMLSDSKERVTVSELTSRRTSFKKQLDRHLFLLFFRQFGSCFGLFDIVGLTKYEIHFHSQQNRVEKLAKDTLFYLFLKLVQIILYFPTMYLYFLYIIKFVSD